MKNVKNKSRFKLGTRILSLFLSLVLLFLFIPTVVYAEVIDALGNDEAVTENKADSSDSFENSTPIYTYKGATYEETELREEGVKHFKLEDGSYVAAQYGMPVHYADESGKWQDIDNSLSEISGVYANNTARIKFAKKINGSAVLFTLKDGNTKLEMSLIGANKGVVPTVINGEDSEAETELQKLMSLEKLSSTIIYPEILDGVDVEYIAHSLNVKENIIVKEKRDSYSYSFELKLNGLTAELAENGDIEIFDKKSGEITYVIPAPVVYDAAGTYAPSSASSFSLADNGNEKYTLTVSASAEWMNADERVFPITIDPTITNSSSSAYVGYSLLSTSPESLGTKREKLYAVDNDISGEKALSSLIISPLNYFDFDYISRIEVNLYCSSGSGYVGTFEPDGTWWMDEVSWNDFQEMYEPYSKTPMDYHYVTAGSYYSFDVSDIMFNCARNDKSTHFAVIAPMTSDTDVEFNNIGSYASGSPYTLIEYRTMSGIEDYWPTTSHSVGNAGTGTVNLANGNLTFEIPLLASLDNLMPVGVSAVYNLNRSYYSSGYMPASFRLNIAETITKKTYKNLNNGNVTYYVHTDADGTDHAYNRVWYWDEQDNERYYDDIFKDEDGLGKTLTLINHLDPNTGITISDDSNITKHFVALDANTWYLTEIEDTSGNKVMINYDTTAKRPTAVSLKPTGLSPINMINFHYNANGKLYIVDNGISGDAIIFNLSKELYTGGIIASEYYLRGVTKYRNTQQYSAQKWKDVAETGNTSGVDLIYSCSYSYDMIGCLKNAIDNTSNYEISYTVSDYITYKHLHRVDEYSNGEIGKSALYYFNYYDNYPTTREILSGGTDADEKTVYYYMDSYGRVTCIYDEATSSSMNYEYENAYEIKNNVKLQYTTPALPSNHIANSLTSFNNGDPFPYWMLENAEFYAEHYQEFPYIVLQPTYNHSSATMKQYVTLNNGSYTLSFDFMGDNEDNLTNTVEITVFDDQSGSIYEQVAIEKNQNYGRYAVSFNVQDDYGYAETLIEIESNYLLSGGNTDENNDGLLDSHIRINNISISEGSTASYTNIVNNGTFDDKTCTCYNDENNDSVWTHLDSSDFWKMYSKALPDGTPTEETLTINRYSYENNNRLELNGDLEKAVYAKQNVYTAHDGILEEFDATIRKDRFNRHLYFYAGTKINSVGALTNEDAKFGIYVEISYYQGNGETVKHGKFIEARKSSSWIAQALLDTKCPEDKKINGKYYGCIQAIDLFLVAYKQPNGSKMYFDDVAFVFVDDAPIVENTYNSEGLLEKTLISYDLAEYYYYTNRNLTKVANDKGVITEYNYDNKNRVISAENYTFRYSGVEEDEATKWQGENADIIITPKHMTVYSYDAFGLVTQERSFPFELNNGTPQKINNEPEYKVFREFNTSGSSKIFGALLAEGGGYDANSTLNLRACDNAKRYFYDEDNGSLIAEVSINGNWGMEYSYNNKGELISVFPAIYDMASFGESYETVTDKNYAMYFYDENNRLSRINSNKVQYTFTYGAFENVTGVGINYDTIISYDYYENNGNIKKITYENGSVVNYVYNSLDLLSEIWYTEIDTESGTPAYTYEYDKLGRLFRVTDYTLNADTPSITEYQYDDMGNVILVSRYVKEQGSYNVSIPKYDSFTYYGYDNNSQLTGYTNQVIYSANNTSHIHTFTSGSYTYDNFGYLQSFFISSNDSAQSNAHRYRVEYSYDEFNRLISRTTDNNSWAELPNYFHNLTMSESFEYSNTNVSDYHVTVTDQANNQTNNDYSYQYDANGNIIRIVRENSNSSHTYEYRYYYDELGQLIRVDDGENSRTVIYTYDYSGNITKKERYDLTAANATPSGTPVVYSYTYGNNYWKDQLTAYDGVAITYDEIGNPLTYYNGLTFTWNGRQLSGYQQDGLTYTYTYDTNGMRTSRTQHRLNGNKTVTNYVYNGDLLVSEETDGNITVYIYDPSGSPIGFQYRKSHYAEGVWDSYFYAKNLQGDIVEIYNNNGTRVVFYSYDAYGKPTATRVGDGVDALNANHLMYRGYYYDFASYSSNAFQGGLGLYYLASRYYDANIGRFISPDDISYLGANGDLNAYNLYAYCSNNPVMHYDPSGHSAVLIAILVGAVLGGIYGGISAELNDQDVGKGIAIGAITGATTATFTGASSIALMLVGTFATGVASDVATQRFLDNKAWGDVNVASAIGAGIVNMSISIVGKGIGTLEDMCQLGSFDRILIEPLLNSPLVGLGMALNSGISKYSYPLTKNRFAN